VAATRKPAKATTKPKPKATTKKRPGAVYLIGSSKTPVTARMAPAIKAYFEQILEVYRREFGVPPGDLGPMIVFWALREVPRWCQKVGIKLPPPPEPMA